jgi:deoxyribose-phosphate aldolase
MDIILQDLNRRFDHAALKPEVTESTIIQLCDEARRYGFYAVAVNPIWVKLASRELAGSGVKVVSVAGFPLGASRSDIKMDEAVRAVRDGAAEMDMVANIGWLLEKKYQKVEAEISGIRSNLPYNIVLKVIIEAGKLTPDQQAEATRCVINGGAQFVKTSTGFFGGASVEQVATLSRAAGGQIEVKASGGIRTLEQCRKLLEAGAARLGSSASAAIMEELLREKNSSC